MLAYLSRYTHRVAISNTRLIAYDKRGVTFRYKDYRADARRKVMTLATDEFIRRFLLHILPKGFHRIRHYGLFANTAAPLTSRGCASCSAVRCRLRRRLQVPVKTNRQRRSCRPVPAAAGA